MGVEALGKEGPKALMHLPRLMEEVFEIWKQKTHKPQFKAESVIHFDGVKPLTEAAQVTAKRLNMSPDETEALVKRYVGYTRELSGPGVKPVPPLFLGMPKIDRDHNPEKYNKYVVPMFAAMDPAPKVRLVYFHAGVHDYMNSEKDLPLGIISAAVMLWHQAIVGGYFVK
jgi:hypothetical protein